jgi:hypothetical protein
MDCYAWKIPEGCYETALEKNAAVCPSVSWWWIAAALAAGAILFGGGKRKAKTARAAKKR